MTQIEHARAGRVTAEIEAVARDEQLDPALVRDEVARGRMVIPANKVHLCGGSIRLASEWPDGRRSTPTSANRPFPAIRNASWRS